MKKTEFYISKMDCPCEEQIIRLKLTDIKDINSLSFDLDKRTLTVYHNGSTKEIKEAIDALNLDADLLSESECHDKDIPHNSVIDKKLLWAVLLINFTFFVIEILFGLLAGSMGLVADSLDMLCDAFVYGISIYALTGTILLKKRIAKTTGILQLILATVGFSEIIRRVIGVEEVPDFKVMIIVSILALTANIASIIILNKSKSNEINIKASQICTSMDIITNLGVIVAGLLVLWIDSGIPDLIVGTIVFCFVLKGAISILKLAK